MLLSSCPSLLNSCPLFLVILSYRVFHSGLQGSFLYSIFLYFLGIKSFHLPWWLFTSCFYLHLLSCCLLLQQKPPKNPHVCQEACSLSQCSSSSHSLDQVGYVISLIFSFMWDRKGLCYWWQPRILIACSLLGFFGCLLFGIFFPFIFYIKPLFYRWIKTVGVAGIYSGKEGW